MAKKTKAASLTIEEKLEQALVVPGYEPYKIPDNWCWTSFKNVAEVVTGGTPSKKHKEYYGNVFPFFKPADLNTGRNVSIASEYLSEEGKKVSRVIPAKSTLVCCIGSIGKSGFLEIEGSTNQQINSAIPKIEPLYLYYYVNTDCFINQLWSKSSATTISIVNKTKMEECYFPLAPLPEQQRIVERIESLFSKLDEAKEKAQEVIDSFETRKAAILHKAFSGELTAKWREENGVGIESWKRKTLGEVCNSIFDGDHMPPPKSESGIPFLVISNVNDGYLSFENTRFVPQEYYDAITDTRKPEKGDVLYTLVGSFGIPVVVDINAPFCFQRHMALLKPKSINTYFLWYLLQSQEMYQKASSIAKGVAQLTVPIKGLRLMDFNCPSEEEQIEIVRILDSLLEKEDTSKDNAESIIDQIDAMKKAILARAFRGELGTNDPEEESAVELLKQILTGE
ncbi:restriction endonuclease subunit S [Ruminococcus sp.]|uniref:restriction endonuclease subunit S n=1 Tax=Ruminococcus sp. TaxID=41978 RepID=UPI00257F3018|nr:restriction endonuclease subunit S [Ruminococcus sp.]